MHSLEIRFSEWKQWKECLRLPKKGSNRMIFEGGEPFRSPGVYLLARFKGDSPTGSAEPTEERIVLIGATWDNTLEGRLDQFHCSAFAPGCSINHGPARTYYRSFNEEFVKEGKELRDNKLFVAVCSLSEKDMLKELESGVSAEEEKRKLHKRFILNVEGGLIWNYALKHKRLPCCNAE